MKKLATAPNLQWFHAWLHDQGEILGDWRYISSVENLYEYRDVEVHVIVGYPSSFARPHGWEWAVSVMKARNIIEVREV
jgi:hypothetical protein